MRMENRAVTFPQTKTILNGVNVPTVQLNDIQAILNMRDAWRYLLNTVNEPVTLEYWCKLNEYIARNEALEWGKLRTGTVAISSTDYMPPCSSTRSGATGAKQYSSRRCFCDRTGVKYLCMGYKRTIFGGRQQAHKFDPCK